MNEPCAARLSAARLATAVGLFGRDTTAQDTWDAFRGATVPGANPARADHRAALLRWLNAAGCRIRYPRDGEPDLFDAGISAWWEQHGQLLPDVEVSITELTDDQIAKIGSCFTELRAAPVALASRPRPLGPTAASKLLHALRPRAIMPWDAAIAKALHGRTDGSAFTAHQLLGRAWGRDVLAETGTDESGLAKELGAPGRPLAKMLDDYCYLAFTAEAAELGGPGHQSITSPTGAAQRPRGRRWRR